MHTQPRVLNKRSGTVLIVVMGMTVLATLAGVAILSSVLSRMWLADKQVSLEQAFYTASAGAERAASFVAVGNEYSTTLTGNLGNGSYVATVDCSPGEGGETQIDIISVGTVKSVNRTVTMRGVRRVSWARYALWYDSEATKLWIIPGERFDGRVYSRPQFHFHDKDLATKGQVRFTDHAATGHATIETSSSQVKPVFEMGLTTSAELETMVSVNFPDMLARATADGVVLEGPSTIKFDGTVMKVTNARAGWTERAMALPANGMIYAKTVTVTERVRVNNRWQNVTTTYIGDVNVAAPNGLQGRVTVVADNNINIIDHLRYKTNPVITPSSTDALGLVALKNVVVETTAPDNLAVFAHMIAKEGGFGVKNYNSGSSRGMLNVYGGIVNKVRNAVGIVGGAGYNKNYVFDKRFAKNPPPNYPKVADELEWTEWDG